MAYNEQWERWIPCEDLVARYYVHSIVENNKGLTITLEEDIKHNRGLSMSFGYAADAYRSTYETLCHQQIIEIDRTYGKEFYTTWSLFTVKNSKYCQWIHENSGGISQQMDYTHYAILTPDLIVDIVSSEKPTINHIILNNTNET